MPFGFEILLAQGAYTLLRSLSADSTDKSVPTKDSSNEDTSSTSTHDSFGDPPPSAPDSLINLFKPFGMLSLFTGIPMGESESDTFIDSSPHSFEAAKRHVDDAEKLLEQGCFREAQQHLEEAESRGFDLGNRLRASMLGVQSEDTAQEIARDRELDERISKLKKIIEDAEKLPEQLKMKIETLRKEIKTTKRSELPKAMRDLDHLEKAQKVIDVLNGLETKLNLEHLRDDARTKIAFGALNSIEDTYKQGLREALVLGRYALAEERQFAVLKALSEKYPATSSIPFHLDYTAANPAIRPYIPKPGQLVAEKSLLPYEPSLEPMENLTIVRVAKEIKQSGSAEEKAMVSSVEAVFEHSRQATGFILSIDKLTEYTNSIESLYQDPKIGKFLARVTEAELKDVENNEGFKERKALSESLQLLADCAVLEEVDPKTLTPEILKGFKEGLLERSKAMRAHFEAEVSRNRALEEHDRPSTYIISGPDDMGTYVPDTSWVGPLEQAASANLQGLDTNIASLKEIDVNDEGAHAALLKLSRAMEENFAHSLINKQIDQVASIDSKKGDVASLRQRLNNIDSAQEPDANLRAQSYRDITSELDGLTLVRTVDARIKMYSELKKPSELADRAVNKGYRLLTFGSESPLINNAPSYDLLVERYQEVQTLIEQGKIDEARKTFVGLEQAQIGPELQKLSESDAEFNLYGVTIGTIIAAGFGAQVVAESLFVEQGVGFYLTMGHLFAANMKGLNALVYEDIKYIYNVDKSPLTNAYEFEKQALADSGMFAFMGVANKVFMQSFEHALLNAARRQLVSEGTLKTGQRILMGSEAEAALMQRAAVIRGYWATKALRAGGAVATELGAFGGWDFLSQGFDPNTLSWEAWKHRACFLGALKVSGALAAPITKPMHEATRRLALARHRPKIELLNRELKVATAKLERSLEKDPDDSVVLEAYRKALEARIRFMDSIPELRNPETYALNKLRLKELGKLESDSQTHQKLFGKGNQFGAESTGPNSGRVDPAKAHAFAKALGEHPHVTDVKVEVNGLITFKYEGEEVRFLPERNAPKTEEVGPDTVEANHHLAEYIAELESFCPELKGKLRAEDVEKTEWGFYKLNPNSGRAKQLIEMLKAKQTDVFPELSISPDMDEATVIARLRTFLENYREAEKIVLSDGDLTHCGWSSTLVNNLLLAKGFEPFHIKIHQAYFIGKNNPMTELLIRISTKMRADPINIQWIFKEFREDMTFSEFEELARDEVGEGADLSAVYDELKNTTSTQRDAIADLSVRGWGHAITAVRIGSRYYLIDINGEQFGEDLDKLTLIPEEDATRHGITLYEPLKQSKQSQTFVNAISSFDSRIVKDQQDIRKQMTKTDAAADAWPIRIPGAPVYDNLRWALLLSQLLGFGQPATAVESPSDGRAQLTVESAASPEGSGSGIPVMVGTMIPFAPGGGSSRGSRSKSSSRGRAGGPNRSSSASEPGSSGDAPKVGLTEIAGFCLMFNDVAISKDVFGNKDVVVREAARQFNHELGELNLIVRECRALRNQLEKFPANTRLQRMLDQQLEKARSKMTLLQNLPYYEILYPSTTEPPKRLSPEELAANGYGNEPSGSEPVDGDTIPAPSPVTTVETGTAPRPTLPSPGVEPPESSVDPIADIVRPAKPPTQIPDQGARPTPSGPAGLDSLPDDIDIEIVNKVHYIEEYIEANPGEPGTEELAGAIRDIKDNIYARSPEETHRILDQLRRNLEMTRRYTQPSPGNARSESGRHDTQIDSAHPTYIDEAKPSDPSEPSQPADSGVRSADSDKLPASPRIPLIRIPENRGVEDFGEPLKDEPSTRRVGANPADKAKPADFSPNFADALSPDSSAALPVDLRLTEVGIKDFLGRYEGGLLNALVNNPHVGNEARAFRNGLSILQGRFEAYKKYYAEFNKNPNSPMREKWAHMARINLRIARERLQQLQSSQYARMIEQSYRNNYDAWCERLETEVGSALPGYQVTIPTAEAMARYYTEQGFKNVPTEKLVVVNVNVESPEHADAVRRRLDADQSGYYTLPSGTKVRLSITIAPARAIPKAN